MTSTQWALREPPGAVHLRDSAEVPSSSPCGWTSPLSCHLWPGKTRQKFPPCSSPCARVRHHGSMGREQHPGGTGGGNPKAPEGTRTSNTPKAATRRPARRVAVSSLTGHCGLGFGARGQQERERLLPGSGRSDPGEGRLLFSAPTGRARAGQLGPGGTGGQRWQRPCQWL